MGETLRSRLRTLRAALAATEAEGIEGPHPGEPHEFRTICSRCGERGMLNVALITDSEQVVIEPRDARSTPEEDAEDKATLEDAAERYKDADWSLFPTVDEVIPPTP